MSQVQPEVRVALALEKMVVGIVYWKGVDYVVDVGGERLRRRWDNRKGRRGRVGNGWENL